DGHVEPGDLGDPQVPQTLRRGLNGILRGVFPRRLARSNQVGDAIDALVGHGDLLVGRCGLQRPPGGSMPPPASEARIVDGVSMSKREDDGMHRAADHPRVECPPYNWE